MLALQDWDGELGADYYKVYQGVLVTGEISRNLEP